MKSPEFHFPVYEQSPEYIEHVSETHSALEKDPRFEVFGAGIANNFALRLKAMIDAPRDTSTDSPDGAAAVRKFFATLQEGATMFDQKAISIPSSPEELKRYIDNYDEGQLRCLIGVHARATTRLKERFESSVEQRKQDFFDRAKEVLGEVVSDDVLTHRLDRLKILFIDSVNNENTDYGGGFIPEKEIVVITSTMIEKGQDGHAFTHELLHALSGRAIVAEASERGMEFSHTKLGLSLRPMDRPNSQYDWLNEAMTETLTNVFHNLPTSGYYATERKALEVLCHGGATPDTFDIQDSPLWDSLLRAYFEGLRENDSPTDGTPNLSAMFTQSKQMFGGIPLLEKIDEEIIATCNAREVFDYAAVSREVLKRFVEDPGGFMKAVAQ